MSRIDLHLHSTASDGRYTPEALVLKAAHLGLTVIALADHDSVDGIEPALREAGVHPGLKVIPAVEISTDTADGEVHILGYFLDYTSQELKATLKKSRDSRVGRAEAMVAKLARLGIYIDWQRVKEIAGSGSIGRPHIAQAMLEKGYINTLREAFDKYIGQNGPAYVERAKMTPEEAVGLIIQSKGLPVLAHPFTINHPEAMIAKLKNAGLVGIEAYYGNSTTEQTQKMVNLVKKYGLIATGGSDYHGLDNNAEAMIGSVEVPDESVEQLTALAEKRRLTTAL